MKTVSFLTLSLIIPLLAASCADLPSGSQKQVEAPAGGTRASSVNYLFMGCPQTTITVGTTMTCTATLDNGIRVGGNWYSSNTAVVRASSGGQIYGVAPGKATVSVWWSNGYGTYGDRKTITVVSGAPLVVSRVTVSSATVYLGWSTQLTARAFDQYGSEITGRPVTWSIDDPSVASISATGVVTGQSLGYTTARASIDGVGGAGTVSVQEYQEPMCGQYYC